MKANEAVEKPGFGATAIGRVGTALLCASCRWSLASVRHRKRKRFLPLLPTSHSHDALVFRCCEPGNTGFTACLPWAACAAIQPLVVPQVAVYNPRTSGTNGAKCAADRKSLTRLRLISAAPFSTPMAAQVPYPNIGLRVAIGHTPRPTCAMLAGHSHQPHRN